MESKVIKVEPIETKSADHAVDTAIQCLEQANGLVIKSQPDYEMAGSWLKKIKGHAKAFDAERKKITVPLQTATKAVMDLFRPAAAKLGEAESIIKHTMVTYETEQERIRQEQQEKLRKQAAVEEARKKKALEEQARKQEEKAAEARRKAAEAEDVKEKARLEAEAQKAEEEAEKRREKKEEVKVEAPVLASRVEAPKGISYTIKWTAEVVDKSKLPIEYLEPNYSMLNKLAQATKGKIPVPGVKYNSEKIVASRAQ